MKDRFGRLSALTRGAALVTLSGGAVGVAGTGCSNNDPPPIPPMTAESVPANPPDASAPPLRRRFPIPNAVRPALPGASDSSTDSGP
jgi:hypothetical protein